MIFLVMGVTGCGKSTIGKLLAEKLSLPFYDADDFHPASNVEKMRAGIPLSDEDRKPWLEELSEKIREWEDKGGVVLACSALKEKYRKMLQSKSPGKIQWIFLEGSRECILERLRQRKGHYMPAALLDSQLEALERPAYGIHADISSSPDLITEKILVKLNNMQQSSEFGIIGLGVMGRSIALNLAEKGTRLSLYNRHIAGSEEQVAKKLLLDNPGFSGTHGFEDLHEFINSLQTPRIIFMMIHAEAVDSQLAELLPLLSKGDVLIDGGNSRYQHTERRVKQLEEAGIHFIGAGVSGGEEGARCGPSVMPGGSEKGWELAGKYLEMIAAKDKQGRPCTTWMGRGGAGHFVKMVHNGIEYAEMQLIAETYSLLRFFLKKSAAETAEMFSQWQQGELNSYLLGITIDILEKKEADGSLLLDKILDQAEQKQTGGWTVSAAVENGFPLSMVAEAVSARFLSAMKAERVRASAAYSFNRITFSGDQYKFLQALKNAYQMARILNHAAGMSMIMSVSDRKDWKINLPEVARIWTQGCIIKSVFMEELAEILKSEKNLLTVPSLVTKLKKFHPDLAWILSEGLSGGTALPVMSSALNFFLGYITVDSPANLIQAQRDYFGAHAYRRTDNDPENTFHTSWKA